MALYGEIGLLSHKLFEWLDKALRDIRDPPASRANYMVMVVLWRTCNVSVFISIPGCCFSQAKLYQQRERSVHSRKTDAMVSHLLIQLGCREGSSLSMQLFDDMAPGLGELVTLLMEPGEVRTKRIATHSQLLLHRVSELSTVLPLPPIGAGIMQCPT